MASTPTNTHTKKPLAANLPKVNQLEEEETKMPTFACLSLGSVLSSGHISAQQGALVPTRQQDCRLPGGTAQRTVAGMWGPGCAGPSWGMSSSYPDPDCCSPLISNWLKAVRLSAASVCTGGAMWDFVSGFILLSVVTSILI